MIPEELWIKRKRLSVPLIEKNLNMLFPSVSTLRHFHSFGETDIKTMWCSSVLCRTKPGWCTRPFLLGHHKLMTQRLTGFECWAYLRSFLASSCNFPVSLHLPFTSGFITFLLYISLLLFLYVRWRVSPLFSLPLVPPVLF